MKPDDPSTLRVWADQGDPDVPGSEHIYHARCPFCNDTRHDTARMLLDVVEAAAALRSSAEECDGWDALQEALATVAGDTTSRDAAARSVPPLDRASPPVARHGDDREYGS